jgi:hypothetical protein
MKWNRVLDCKPQIPEGKYGVSCIVASFDPCYDEINHGMGYTVTTMVYKNNVYDSEGFYQLDSENEWHPAFDVVTHWMYLPEAPEYDPEVLNPIFQWYHDHSRPQSPLKQI